MQIAVQHGSGIQHTLAGAHGTAHDTGQIGLRQHGLQITDAEQSNIHALRPLDLCILQGGGPFIFIDQEQITALTQINVGLAKGLGLHDLAKVLEGLNAHLGHTDIGAFRKLLPDAAQSQRRGCMLIGGILLDHQNLQVRSFRQKIKGR